MGGDRALTLRVGGGRCGRQRNGEQRQSSDARATEGRDVAGAGEGDRATDVVSASKTGSGGRAEYLQPL